MRTLAALALCCALPSVVSAQDEPAFSFVVLGHLRGDPASEIARNPMLEEVVEDCIGLKPDLVLLSGDSIWGDYHNIPADPTVVWWEWDVLDRELAKIGAPILRVPGNHDISDLETRDIFFRRYGAMPRAERFGDRLFLLLSTAWLPPDGDTTQTRQVHGVPLDQTQLEFASAELAAGTHEHAFVVVHHLHWWRDDAIWWQTAHQRFVDQKVRAVIGGDYGPTKYSHRVVDGITYVHASIASEPGEEMLLMNEEARQLSQQLDCFLHFTVQGEDVQFELRTVGLGEAKHDPLRWERVNHLPVVEYVYYATLGAIPRRWKLAMLLLGVGVAAGAGLVLLCVWWLRWRHYNSGVL